jgi:hypothetical protein
VYFVAAKSCWMRQYASGMSVRSSGTLTPAGGSVPTS